MQADFASWISRVWTGARSNDLPNWFAAAFSLIVWPLALTAWHRRTINNVQGLEVRLSPTSILIGNAAYAAVDIEFMNHTGSVTYVSGGRIRRRTRAFEIPSAAARDIAENSYHLKFMNTAGAFVMREVTIQTDASSKTCIAVSTPLNGGFWGYTAPWYRRALRMPKYFLLEYDAMVGNSSRRVATIY